MKRILFTPLLLLLLCGGASAQGAKPAEGGGQKMSLTGVVYDPNGSVIVNGVEVIAEAPGGKRFETSTDDEGFFKLSLPLGVYSVRVRAPAFCTSEVEGFRVVNSTHGKMSLDFVLEPSGSHTSCRQNRKNERRPGKQGSPKIIIE